MELQQRSCEFQAIAGRPDLSSGDLLSRMPTVDAAALHSATAGVDGLEAAMAADTEGTTSMAPATNGVAPAAAAHDDVDDLLGGFDAPVTHAVSSSAAAAAPVPAPAPAASNDLDLLGDLFGGGSAAPAPAPVAAAAAVPAPAAATDVFGGLEGLFGASAPAPAPAAAAVPVPAPAAAPVAPAMPPSGPAAGAVPLQAFNDGTLRVMLNFTKPAGPQSNQTDVSAVITNAGAAPLTDFVFLVAVPKVCDASAGVRGCCHLSLLCLRPPLAVYHVQDQPRVRVDCAAQQRRVCTAVADADKHAARLGASLVCFVLCVC